MTDLEESKIERLIRRITTYATKEAAESDITCRIDRRESSLTIGLYQPTFD